MNVSRRAAFGIIVCGICALSGCRERVAYDPRLDEDAITHLAVHRPDVADDVWVRVGEPDEVCRFEALLRRAIPAKPLDGGETCSSRFFVKWQSGREAVCTLGPDNSLRFWHLAIVLDDRDHAFLNGLLEAVRSGTASWPSGVPRPSIPNESIAAASR